MFVHLSQISIGDRSPVPLTRACLFRNLIEEELPTTRRLARPVNTSVYQGSVRGSCWRRSGGGRSRRSTCPRRRRVLDARLLGLQRYRRVVRRATRLR